MLAEFPAVWERSKLTSQNASASTAVLDASAGIDAKLSRRKSTADTVLSISKLANRSGSPSRGSQAEAASGVTGNQSIRSNRNSGDRTNSLHHGE